MNKTKSKPTIMPRPLTNRHGKSLSRDSSERIRRIASMENSFDFFSTAPKIKMQIHNLFIAR